MKSEDSKFYEGYVSESDTSDTEFEEEDNGWDSIEWVPDDYDMILLHSIRCDRKDRFVEVWSLIIRYGVSMEVFDDPLHAIFLNDSANCWKAVLNGETPGLLENIDVNAVPFTNYNPQPVPVLHKAAWYGAPRIINLCLPGNEAQLNLRIDVDGMKGVLPLNLALLKLWTSIEDRFLVPPHDKIPIHRLTTVPPLWISEPSLEEPHSLVYKLIFKLLTSHRKCPIVETVKILASKTVEIEQEFFKYVKERKLLELTALLLLAHDIFAPCCEGGSKIRDLVSKEIAALKLFIFRSTYEDESDKLIYEARKKKMEMEAIMLVLEIFNRVGNKIAAYLRQLGHIKLTKVLKRVGEVSWLLKEAGFDAELDLLEEIIRTDSNTFNIIKDIPETNKEEESNTGLTNNDHGQPVENHNSYRRMYHARINTEAQQPSTRWLVNKQDMITELNRKARISDSFRHQFARGYRDICSTTINKGCPLRSTCHSSAYASGYLCSTTAGKINGMVPKFQLEKQYQDFGKSPARRITGVCNWRSYLQFNRERVLSTNSNRWILWIANKLGRAL